MHAMCKLRRSFEESSSSVGLARKCCFRMCVSVTYLSVCLSVGGNSPRKF
jgi:hypothetical protein